MLDRAALFGEPFAEFAEVQTLDECLLIHRNEGPGKAYFDEAVPGWHAYGVEACCAAIREGKRNYVIAAPVWHDSKSTNLAGLAEAHAYVWRKHGGRFEKIHTTCGVLPGLYADGPAARALSLAERARGYLRQGGLRVAGEMPVAERWFEEELEAMTEVDERIDCLHTRAAADPLEARAFLPMPQVLRSVTHHFRGLELDVAQAACVVIARELTEALLRRPEAIEQLRARGAKVLVCLELDVCWKRPLAFRKLIRRMQSWRLAYSWDGAPVLIGVG
jgi:hypothetical protein